MPQGRDGGERRPAVIAHRGASAIRPEHTLGAFRQAIRDGADAIECDVRMTLDGHLVCLHDRSVDRTSDGHGLVSRHTLRQLQALDWSGPVSYTHLRAHETVLDLECRLLLENTNSLL